VKGHRWFRAFRDNEGNKLIEVSLGTEGTRFAVIEEDAFLDLIRGGLSSAWRLVGKKGYVAAHGKGEQNLSVGRVLLGAKQGDLVRYLDNDPTNLRASNLLLVKGKGAIRNDRELVR
jgi:hypothetical protein